MYIRSFAVRLSYYSLNFAVVPQEHVTGIEPVSSVWKTEMLAVTLHVHNCIFDDSENASLFGRDLKKKDRKFFSSFYIYYSKNFRQSQKNFILPCNVCTNNDTLLFH